MSETILTTDTFRVRLLVQHLKLAVRVLLNAPAFSALVIVILALGIGANTAVFSVIDAVLLRQLPYGDPNRLVVLWEKNHSLGTSIGERVPVSHANFVEWVRQANLTLSVRSSFDPHALTAAVKQQIWAVDKGPVYNVLHMQDILDDTVSQRPVLLSLFGGLGILLACIGIYGALTFNVVQRTRDVVWHATVRSGNLRDGLPCLFPQSRPWRATSPPSVPRELSRQPRFATNKTNRC